MLYCINKLPCLAQIKFHSYSYCIETALLCEMLQCLREYCEAFKPRAILRTLMMRMMVGLMGSEALTSISSRVMPMMDSSTMARSSWFHLHTNKENMTSNKCTIIYIHDLEIRVFIILSFIIRAVQNFH